MNSGWFTVPELYRFTDESMQRAKKGAEDPPTFLDPDLALDYKPPNRLFAPSETILRRIVDRMVTDGKLHTMTWHKEVGRPAVLYYSDEMPPLLPGARCGQCAFYISLYKHCRLWSLLGKSIGIGDPRWKSDGDHPLTSFELYKMKNAWKISPHASACSKFVDKKRDYSLKLLPDTCDICAQPLPATRGKLVLCTNCRTRYSATEKSVRVLTAYEDRFEKTYEELSGHSASLDITRLREKSAGSGFGFMEEIDFQKNRAADEGQGSQPITLVLFAGDKMLVRDGQLFLLGTRRVESVPLKETVIVDHGVLEEEQVAKLRQAGVIVRSVAKPVEMGEIPAVRYELGRLIRDRLAAEPGFPRRFSTAMARSAMNASERIRSLAGMSPGVTQPLIDEQSRLLRRMELAPLSSLLAYEALIMRRYWAVYEANPRVQSQRFGPRKKARFVREQVTSATGRARGYTAVDAAINYLHQRRLYKVRQINSRLGISAYGEGLLHHKKRNALGLVLDLSDPLKFADREKLLEAILKYAVNWRDFHTATDRQGTNFYYPKSEVVSTLENLSDEADEMMIDYGGTRLKLTEAYEQSVQSLVPFLTGSSSSYEPFVYKL